jgi:hypothetical protein
MRMTKAELIKLNTPEPKMRRMRRLMLDAEKGVSHTVSLRDSIDFLRERQMLNQGEVEGAGAGAGEGEVDVA